MIKDNSQINVPVIRANLQSKTGAGGNKRTHLTNRSNVSLNDKKLNQSIGSGVIKFATFEEQLVIDQKKMQLQEKKQFWMIKNIQDARTTISRKNSSFSGKFLRPKNQNQLFHSRRVSSTNSAVDESLIFDMSSRREYKYEAYRHNSSQNQPNRTVRQTSSKATDSNRQNQYANMHVNDILRTRIPNYSLAYSASGQLLPRRLVHKNVINGSEGREETGSLTTSTRLGDSTAYSVQVPHSQKRKFKQSKPSLKQEQHLYYDNNNNSSIVSMMQESSQRNANEEYLNQQSDYVAVTEAKIKGRLSSQEKMFLPSIRAQSQLVQVGKSYRASRENKQFHSMAIVQGPEPLLTDKVAAECCENLSQFQIQEVDIGVDDGSDLKELKYSIEQPVVDDQNYLMPQTRAFSAERAQEHTDISEKINLEKSYAEQFSSTMQPKVQTFSQRNNLRGEGPQSKKFRVLAAFKGEQLKKQFSKHFQESTNKLQLLRLKQELDNKYSREMVEISKGLKPVGYRDLSQPMGYVQEFENGRKSDLQIRDVRSVGSVVPSMDDKQEDTDSSSISSDSEVSYGEQQLKKVMMSPTVRKRHGSKHKSTQPEDDFLFQGTKDKKNTLPEGLKVEALYDDELYQQWYSDNIMLKPKTHEKRVAKTLRCNQRQNRRRRIRREKAALLQHEKDQSELKSVHLSSGENSSSSSSSAASKAAKKEIEQINTTKKEEFKASSDADFEDNIMDPEKLAELIKQVAGEEDQGLTLKLPKAICDTLTSFKVKGFVEGAPEKRANYLLNMAYLRMFHKFNKFIKQRGNLYKNKEDRTIVGVPQAMLKKYYEEKAAKEEEELMSELEKIGEAGLESQAQHIKQRALQKLLDSDKEILEWKLLEAKGMALKELLRPQGPSKEVRDFQRNQQAFSYLNEVRLKQRQNLSISPQRAFVTSPYGEDLMAKVGRTNNAEAIKSRKTVVRDKILNAVQILSARDLKQVESFNSFRTSDAVTAKQEKRMIIKRKLEQNMMLEVFEQSALSSQYFKSIKEQSQHENDRDRKINKDFSDFCIQKANVYDLPIFSHIKNHELSLTDYFLNSGVSKAIGAYFAESNWRIDRKFLIRELVLDNNNLQDIDFAEIIAGLAIQAKLQQLTYVRNTLGMESVIKLEDLIQQQEAAQIYIAERLNQISFIKVKTSSDVLSFFFQNVLTAMPNLTQLKLQGISLGRSELSDALITALEKHKDRLELLDLQDCQMNGAQIEKITGALKESFGQLHSLNLSFNLAKEKGGRILANICDMITKKSKLNHLNLSYMALGFDACQSVLTAVSKSESLCALHISGNQLVQTEQRFLLRTLGIDESELDTKTGGGISLDALRATLDTSAKDTHSIKKEFKMDVGQPKSPDNLVTQSSDMSLGGRGGGPFADKTFTVHDIVGASAHKDNQERIAKMHSQHNGQSGVQCTPFSNLVFTRQVYTPELFFNQDTNRQKVLIDKSGPFAWHVNFQDDGCFICQRWRYCLLFFSRKTVMDGEFFKPIIQRESKVALDKICGFSDSKTREMEGEQPWLVGTITALHKSQFVPLKEYLNLLKWRLQNSHYLKASKNIEQMMAEKIKAFFGAGGDGESMSGMQKLRAMAKLKNNKTAPDRNELQMRSNTITMKKSNLVTQADNHQRFARHHTQKQQVHFNDDEESSDFSVDEHSTLLELMQKLRKIQPEALILNYSKLSQEENEEDDEMVSSNHTSVDRQSSLYSGQQSSQAMNKVQEVKKNIFVFAAYVPPGKHLVVVRDTNMGVKLEDSTQRNNGNLKTFDSLRKDSCVISSEKHIGRLCTERENASGKLSLTGRSGSQEVSQAQSFQLRRMRNAIREHDSEYFMKELLVEPRENIVLKTFTEPFSYKDMPMNEKSQPVMLPDLIQSASKSLSSVVVNKVPTESVFRNWLEETEKCRRILFKDHVMAPLRNEMVKPPSMQLAPEKSSPRIASRLSERQISTSMSRQQPELKPQPAIFSCLADQQQAITTIFSANFQEIREFFLELAAMDAFSFPLVSMHCFASLCLKSGTGYMKTSLQDEQPDMAKLKNKKSSKAGKTKSKSQARQKRSRVQTPSLDDSMEEAVQPLKPLELYFDDLKRPVSHITIGADSRQLIQGELKKGLSSDLMVEQGAFLAHLLKIAIIWTNGHADGIQALPTILTKIIKEDIPYLRQELAVQNQTIVQVFRGVQLPYEFDDFQERCQLQMMLSSQFRRQHLHNNSLVNNVLKVFQRSLIALFMTLTGHNPQLLLQFEMCELVQAAMPLSSFRPKKLNNRKPLNAVIKSMLQQAKQAQPPQFALKLETIQTCFAKSKQLEPEQRLDASDHQSRPHNMANMHKKQSVIKQYPKGDEQIDNKLEAISAKPIDFKQLVFVEWLEFICRLATCVFVFDSKLAAKTRNAAMQRLIEDSKKPFAHQLAIFLTIFLEQLLFEFTKRKAKNGGVIQERDMDQLQDVYDQIPADFEEVIQQLTT